MCVCACVCEGGKRNRAVTVKYLKTYKRLKSDEIRQDANFRGNPLFQATYIEKKEKKR